VWSAWRCCGRANWVASQGFAYPDFAQDQRVRRQKSV
jgi:hypothetical protein